MFCKATRIFLQAVGLITILTLFAGGVAVVSLGNWLQYQDQLQKADYIVPLAGDGDRFLYAVELYKQGFAPRILLGNDHVEAPNRSQKLRAELGYPLINPHELRTRLLKYLSVPDDAVATFGDQYISTLEEAEALKTYIGGRAVAIIVVTSPYHTRRAKIIFESKIPYARFVVVPSPEGRLQVHWWNDQESARQTLLETAKIVYFWLGGAFRAAR